jgi:N-acetylneuraminate synthase/N,N'-diacetyllegionaminate synthase
MKEVKIGNKWTGDGNPAFIVAELGVNHMGDPSLAKKMIDKAKECGVNAVKLQTFKTEDFVSDEKIQYEYYEGRDRRRKVKESMFKMFKRYELNFNEQRKLFRHARSIGMEIFSTPSFREGVDFLDKIGVNVFKVGSDDLTNLELVEYIAKKGKPIILSTGMSTLGEIEDAIDTAQGTGNHNIILMQCVSLYPAPVEYSNLRAIESMKRMFEAPVGFSDHTIGTLASTIAVAMGANMIEKHFTLDKDFSGPDHWFSADVEELKKLVTDIRSTEKAMGKKRKMLYDFEKEAHDSHRRSIVANCDIPKRSVIKKEMICFKRPGNGLPPKFEKYMIGRITKVDIKKNEQITFDKIS